MHEGGKKGGAPKGSRKKEDLVKLGRRITAPIPHRDQRAFCHGDT